MHRAFGIATDDTTKFYFQKIMEEHGLSSLYDFENREGIFPGVHRSYKFCLLTLTGKERTSKEADFVFFAQRYEDLADKERHFALSDAEIRLLNPNTRTCPVFRSKKDAELTKGVYRKVPVLIKEGEREENPWGISFMRMFDMSNDSGLFKTREQCERDGFKLTGNVFVNASARRLPLYEAKMIHHFDHRWATYDGTDTRDVTLAEKQNPNFFVLPRYWVDEIEVEHALGERKKEWFIGWRDITRSTDERTCLMTIWPYAAAGDTFLQMFPSVKQTQLLASLVAGYSSFIFDYITRQKIGGIHLKYHYFKQLPVLPPTTYTSTSLGDHAAASQRSSSGVEMPLGSTIGDWLLPRVLELAYTANDLEPFALDCGYDGPPFVWNEERRFLIRCEIDAAFFHLYDIARDDVAYVMDTFPIVRRKDEKQYGAYRTKDTILDIYDAMAEAARSGAKYATRLSPAPGER